jgi:hypothetical protein
LPSKAETPLRRRSAFHSAFPTRYGLPETQAVTNQVFAMLMRPLTTRATAFGQISRHCMRSLKLSCN